MVLNQFSDFDIPYTYYNSKLILQRKDIDSSYSEASGYLYSITLCMVVAILWVIIPFGIISSAYPGKSLQHLDGKTMEQHIKRFWWLFFIGTVSSCFALAVGIVMVVEFDCADELNGAFGAFYVYATMNFKIWPGVTFIFLIVNTVLCMAGLVSYCRKYCKRKKNTPFKSRTKYMNVHVECVYVQG